MEQNILAFFQNYAAACNRGDDEAAANAFAPDFLYADEGGSKIVRREQMRAGIEQRRKSLGSSGAGLTVLEHVEVTMLDPYLALARTLWRIDSSTGQSPLSLESSFLVEVCDNTTHILAYLAHVSLAQAIRNP